MSNSDIKFILKSSSNGHCYGCGNGSVYLNTHNRVGTYSELEIDYNFNISKKFYVYSFDWHQDRRIIYDSNLNEIQRLPINFLYFDQSGWTGGGSFDSGGPGGLSSYITFKDEVYLAKYFPDSSNDIFLVAGASGGTIQTDLITDNSQVSFWDASVSYSNSNYGYGENGTIVPGVNTMGGGGGGQGYLGGLGGDGGKTGTAGLSYYTPDNLKSGSDIKLNKRTSLNSNGQVNITFLQHTFNFSESDISNGTNIFVNGPYLSTNDVIGDLSEINFTIELPFDVSGDLSDSHLNTNNCRILNLTKNNPKNYSLKLYPNNLGDTSLSINSNTFNYSGSQSSYQNLSSNPISFSHNGMVKVPTGSTWNITDSTTFDASIVIDGTFTIAGSTTATLNAEIFNNSNDSFNNYGLVNINDTYTNKGTIRNYGTLIINGTLNNTTSGKILNYGTIKNYGTVNNEGTINSSSGSFIVISPGTFINTGIFIGKSYTSSITLMASKQISNRLIKDRIKSNYSANITFGVNSNSGFGSCASTGCK